MEHTLCRKIQSGLLPNSVYDFVRIPQASLGLVLQISGPLLPLLSGRNNPDKGETRWSD